MLKQFRIEYIGLFVLILVIGCKSDVKNSQTETATETSTSHVNTLEFSAESNNMRYNRGIATTDLYLYWNKKRDRIKFAEDNIAKLIREEDRESLNIPEDAVFSIKAIYGGYGHLYYGIAENNNSITLYRHKTENFVETMQSSAETIVYEKFHTLVFSEDSYTLE